jgi:cyclophilin family peptidyl-prolyl cis-trans isomerase
VPRGASLAPTPSNRFRRAAGVLQGAAPENRGLRRVQRENYPPRGDQKEGGNVADAPVDEIAIIETNQGTIQVKFYPGDAPKAVENFKGLAKKGYYNGVIFHRVIDGFMIQGGDPTGTGTGGKSFWGKEFEDEFSPKLRFDRKGLLAMANAGPRTNGSQFFITLAPTGWLDRKHTIFGEVISGMDVVEKIAKVKKDARDKPVEPVTMKKVTIAPAAPGK